MKTGLTVLISLLLITVVFAETSDQATSQYATSKASGTIMISGGGTYTTDLSEELRTSRLDINTDAAMFLFPQIALGINFGYRRDYEEIGVEDNPTEVKDIGMYLGPRAYFFLGGTHSQFTPFIKGGANYLKYKRLVDDEEVWSDEKELGLTASLGILLNLAKNVGLSVEAEYNFEKGTAVEDIDTEELLIKFSLRSFLGD